MRRNIFAIFLSSILLCSGVLSAKADQPVVKEWTFLVYLNGKNSLDSFGPMNLKQMEKVGSNENLNIVVEWGSMKFPTVKRMLIQKSTNPNEVTSPVVQDAGVVDMGDYHSLIEFVRWAQANYPARHYMIDVWDHGSGWHAKRSRAGFQAFDISWDDATGHSITTLQLGQAMTEISHILGQKVDIYASDACLMAMAEIATEMQDSVHMFVGSEDLEPGEGWPYDDFLTKWAALPEKSPVEVSKLLVTSYLTAYTSQGQYGPRSTTMSAFDLTNWGEFLSATKDFARDMKNVNATDKKLIMKIANQSQAFYSDDYKDMGDFLGRLKGATVASLNVASVDKLKASASSVVVAAGASNHFPGAKGLSFWLPTYRYTFTEYQRAYSDLAFDKATGWGDTLNFLLTN